MAQRAEADPKMDPNALYREEIVTDRKVGTIRMMTPLSAAGTPDASRETLFVGEAQIMTGAGPLPINFEIDATDLAGAVDKFGSAAKEAIERTVRDLQEMRRQQASSIVVPGAGGMGGMGGLGGGGKIQIP
ncbi:MAG: hypothetical protein V4637_01245 [Pseudomonadota bacterium]